MPALAGEASPDSASAGGERCSDPKWTGDCIGSQFSRGVSTLPRRPCPQAPQKLASGALLAPQAAHTCLASCSCSCITILLPPGLSTKSPIDEFLPVAMNRLPFQRYQSGLITRPV